jgi:hypothetical protein
LKYNEKIKKYMKRRLKILTIAAFLAIAPMLMFAQTPPDPPDGGGGGGNPGGPPVGAPVGDGIYLLAALAFAYGSRKVYVMNTAEKAMEA